MPIQVSRAMRMCVAVVAVHLTTVAPTHGETREVIQSILGREISNDQFRSTIIYANGSLEGVFNGIAFAGHWTFQDGLYCRTFTRGLSGATSCMDVVANRSPNGEIVGIFFEGDSKRTYFTVLSQAE